MLTIDQTLVFIKPDGIASELPAAIEHVCRIGDDHAARWPSVVDVAIKPCCRQFWRHSDDFDIHAMAIHARVFF